MAVTYQNTDAGFVGTMTCDRVGCESEFHDGQTECGNRSIHMRSYEAGWRMERPTPYHQTDKCPTCPRDLW